MISKDLVKKVTEIFILYFEDDYKKLIEERMSSLLDIIFFDRNINNDSISVLDDAFFKKYGILNYQQEIIKGEIPFSKDLIEYGYQGLMPFIKNNRLNSIIYFPRTITNQYNYDCVLIHEFLHVLDEHIIINNEDLMVTRGGFDTMVLKGDYQERQYEYFNELIHQKIAEDVTFFAHNQGIYLFNNYDDSLMSRSESYKDNNPVIDLFFNTFKEKLIIDKMTGDINNFIDYIGMQNFIDFNNWIKNYYDTYITPNDRSVNKESFEHRRHIEDGLLIVNKMINTSRLDKKGDMCL
jgi:hypothetical protein